MNSTSKCRFTQEVIQPKLLNDNKLTFGKPLIFNITNACVSDLRSGAFFEKWRFLPNFATTNKKKVTNI